MNLIDNLKNELKKTGNIEKSQILQRFFKTEKGQYGEGDIFLGIMVPETRKIAIKYKDLNEEYIKELLKSKIHEERLAALLILVHNFQKGDIRKKEEVYNFYLRNAKYINNWDLVDLTADKILGAWIFDKNKYILYKLAKSENLWERRIAIISTFYFIKNNEFKDALKISEILLKDKHDLIQKAVGWMLREIGKRNEQELIKFLDEHYKSMPRTMLRYAIERLDKNKKEFYMGR